MVVDDQGTTLQAMTFNGSMPGPTLVVHEGSPTAHREAETAKAHRG